MKTNWDISYIKEAKFDQTKNAWLVYGVLPKRDSNGKRQRLRRYFNTEEEANHFREAAQTEWDIWYKSGNFRLSKLNQSQEAIAILAYEALYAKIPEDTPNLLEVVEHYLKSPQGKGRMTINEAVEKFQRWDGLLCRSDSHVTQFKRRTTRFALAYENKPIGEFNKQTIEEWKDYRRQTGVSEMEIRNELTCLNRFFVFCVNEEFIDQNPVTKVFKPDFKRKRIKIWSNDQIRNFLTAATEIAGGDLVPYFALGTFCAIRPEELNRLDWADVNFDEKTVLVEGKTGYDRLVEIPDNCIEWIKPYALESGAVVDEINLRKRLNLIYALAGVRRNKYHVGAGRDGPYIPEEYADRLKNINSNSRPEYIKDGLRKTGITWMAVKEKSNLYKVAEWVGNSPKIIKSHYLAVRSVNERKMEEFFNILPDSCAKAG